MKKVRGITLYKVYKNSFVITECSLYSFTAPALLQPAVILCRSELLKRAGLNHSEGTTYHLPTDMYFGFTSKEAAQRYCEAGKQFSANRAKATAKALTSFKQRWKSDMKNERYSFL